MSYKQKYTFTMSRHLMFVSILFVIFAFSSCKEKKAGKAEKTSSTLKVEGLIIKEEKLDNFIETTGSVTANEEVQLKSEIAGRITLINFNEGEEVRKGQLLLEVDNAQYKAQLKRVKVQLEQARRNEDRQKQLLEIEGISKESYEQSQLQVAELEAEQAELEALLNNTVIRAPFDGTIGLRTVSPGGYVSSGDNIAYLVQSNPVKINFSIPEIYAGQLEAGAEITFTTSAAPDTLKATIYAIEPRIDPVSRSIDVRALTDNPGRKLIPGAFTEIRVNLRSFPQTIMIPTSAANIEINGKSVYVVQEGKARRREITSGIRTSTQLQVLSGLEAGDTLITTGLLGLKEGMEVEISQPENGENQKDTL